MHRSRALTHLSAFVEAAEKTLGLPGALPLQSVWVSGALLEGGEPEEVDVVLGVDLPPDEVPWGCAPRGARHLADATRLSRLPLRPLWRSSRSPVENHVVVRPLLLWTVTDGLRAPAWEALAAGRAEELREAAPEDSADRARHHRELVLARTTLAAAVDRYDADRWTPAGAVSAGDALAAAARGLLDLEKVTNA